MLSEPSHKNGCARLAGESHPDSQARGVASCACKLAQGTRKRKAARTVVWGVEPLVSYYMLTALRPRPVRAYFLMRLPRSARKVTCRTTCARLRPCQLSGERRGAEDDVAPHAQAGPLPIVGEVAACEVAVELLGCAHIVSFASAPAQQDVL